MESYESHKIEMKSNEINRIQWNRMTSIISYGILEIHRILWNQIEPIESHEINGSRWSWRLSGRWGGPRGSAYWWPSTWPDGWINWAGSPRQSFCVDVCVVAILYTLFHHLVVYICLEVHDHMYHNLVVHGLVDFGIWFEHNMFILLMFFFFFFFDPMQTRNLTNVWCAQLRCKCRSGWHHRTHSFLQNFKEPIYNRCVANFSLLCFNPMNNLSYSRMANNRRANIIWPAHAACISLIHINIGISIHCWIE